MRIRYLTTQATGKHVARKMSNLEVVLGLRLPDGTVFHGLKTYAVVACMLMVRRLERREKRKDGTENVASFSV